MTKKTQIITVFTVLAAVWLALVVILAGGFVIEKYDHQHIDSENCQICLVIQISLRLMEAFGRLGMSIAVIGFIIYALSFVKPQRAYCLFNPIKLKVKFIS